MIPVIDVAADPRFQCSTIHGRDMPVIGWIWGPPEAAPQYGGGLLNGVPLTDLDHVAVTVHPTVFRNNGKVEDWVAEIAVVDHLRQGTGWRSRRLTVPVDADQTPEDALGRMMSIAASGAIDTTPERVLQRDRIRAALELLADLAKRPSRDDYTAWLERHGLQAAFPGGLSFGPLDYDPQAGQLYQRPAGAQASIIGALRVAWTAADKPGWEDQLWAWKATAEV